MPFGCHFCGPQEEYQSPEFDDWSRANSVCPPLYRGLCVLLFQLSPSTLTLLSPMSFCHVSYVVCLLCVSTSLEAVLILVIQAHCCEWLISLKRCHRSHQSLAWMWSVSGYNDAGRRLTLAPGLLSLSHLPSDSGLLLGSNSRRKGAAFEMGLTLNRCPPIAVSRQAYQSWSVVCHATKTCTTDLCGSIHEWLLMLTSGVHSFFYASFANHPFLGPWCCRTTLD